MGIKLVVEVMDHAPADLTPAERLVLVVIAENVRDGDLKRQTWPGFNAAVLAKRAGLTGDGSLKRALQRLAKRGMEVRVPIATGKDGRELYAVPGQQCRYRLPIFATEGGTTVPPSMPQGGTTVPPGGTTVPPKGGPESRQAGPQSPPSPLPSDIPSSLSRPSVPEQRTAEPAASEREKLAAPTSDKPTDPAAAVAEAWATARGGHRNPMTEAKIRTAAAVLLAADWNLADVTALAKDMARRFPTYTDLGQHADHWQPAAATAAAPKRAALPDWCERCSAGDPAARFNYKVRTVADPTTGKQVPCPTCHPDMINAEGTAA